MARRVPADLSAVQTKRLVRQLTAATEAILSAVDTFIKRPDSANAAAMTHVRGWCAEAYRDARRLHQVLAPKDPA